MSFNDTAYNETPILGDDVLPAQALEYWVLIGGFLEDKVLMDSLNIEESGDGITRARCTVVNPSTTILGGKTFSVIWRGEVIFGGIIRTLSIDMDQAETAIFYAIEADGWDSLLARHTITATYNNQTAGFIFADMITATGLDLDGVTVGVVDAGIELILVEADHVRVGDFIRDVGAAGGGLAYIDPYKRIQFRPTTLDHFPDGAIWNDRAEKIKHMDDLDNYRNRQIVKVTGLDGTTTVTETRDDLAQQALRIADEGGSGIYEAYESITHPTSSVPGELSILGQTVGYVNLRTYARNARRVTVTMREPAPKIGQLATLDLPGFTLSGTFVAMRKTWRDVSGQFVFEVEFWESNFQQVALQSLLRIVRAGKAAVSISAEIFPNVQLFSTVGSFTWTVPVGITSAQFTAYGGSGGGAGTVILITTGLTLGGGAGGNSGKAVTILTVVPAQVYDVIVGDRGLGGAVNTNGTAGTLSSVSLSAVDKCRGDGGGGGNKPVAPNHGVPGTAGSGLGDAVSVGGGIVGGAGGPAGQTTNYPGVNGGTGLVEVRW